MSEQLDIFEIDKDLLDEAWFAQPKLYYQYASELDVARTALDEVKRSSDLCKLEMEEVRAGVDLKIREAAANSGSKVTEASIGNNVLLSGKYKEARDYYYKSLANVDDVKAKVNALQTIVNSLDQKKAALENLVRLHGQNYFSTPRAPEGSHEMVDRMKKKAIRSKGRE